MTIATNQTGQSEALRIAMDRHMLGVDGALPCVVQAVSADGTTVDVIPAVRKAQTLDGVRSALPATVIKGVPIALYGSTTAGLYACPPIQAGDDGIIIAMDRALDNWQGGSGSALPPEQPTPRHHDFTDAMFYPGAQRRSSALSSFPTDAFTIQNRAGDTVASVKDGEMSLNVGGISVVVTDTGVQINGPLNVTGGISGGSGSSITGNVSVTGNIAATGTVTGSNIS